MPVDVADPTAIRNGFAVAADSLGAPAALITCAGSADALGPVAQADPERWWNAVAVDLRGTMMAAQAALGWMLPARAGRIVTIYGNLGDRGQPNLSAFAVAKASVARLTETLASELAATGVVVIGLHPGFVRTPMTQHLAWSEEGGVGCPTSAVAPSSAGAQAAMPYEPSSTSSTATRTTSRGAPSTPQAA